jgi:uncharacterized protein
MNNYESSYSEIQSAQALDVDRRSAFITRTYVHLTAAMFAFASIEVFFFKTGLAAQISKALLGTSWLLVLGGFMVISWLATHAAHRAVSKATQYAALSAYVVAQAVIFAPLLYLADAIAPGAIASAAMVTYIGFAGLTAVAMLTRKDFSFLRGLLCWGGVIALVTIVSASVFGMSLGSWFSVGMVAFAGAAILYDTSEVLHRYPEDRYVAASLELFASVALLFWYVLRLFMSSRD